MNYFQILLFALLFASSACLGNAQVLTETGANPTQKVANDTASNANEKDRKLGCLNSKIILSDAKLSPDHETWADVKIQNNLQWAVAGVRLGYKIRSEGREVAWKEGETVASISGGIESGETRKVDFYVGNISPDAPKDRIKVEVTILDVADAQKRQYVGGVTAIGWADDLSTKTCE